MQRYAAIAVGSAILMTELGSCKPLHIDEVFENLNTRCQEGKAFWSLKHTFQLCGANQWISGQTPAKWDASPPKSKDLEKWEAFRARNKKGEFKIPVRERLDKAIVNARQKVRNQFLGENKNGNKVHAMFLKELDRVFPAVVVVNETDNKIKHYKNIYELETFPGEKSRDPAIERYKRQLRKQGMECTREVYVEERPFRYMMAVINTESGKELAIMRMEACYKGEYGGTFMDGAWVLNWRANHRVDERLPHVLPIEYLCCFGGIRDDKTGKMRPAHQETKEQCIAKFEAHVANPDEVYFDLEKLFWNPVAAGTNKKICHDLVDLPGPEGKDAKYFNEVVAERARFWREEDAKRQETLRLETLKGRKVLDRLMRSSEDRRRSTSAGSKMGTSRRETPASNPACSRQSSPRRTESLSRSVPVATGDLSEEAQKAELPAPTGENGQEY